MSALEMPENEAAALDELEWLASGPHTLEEIAARLGIHREYVRQIERRAIRKMQRAARRAGHSFRDLIEERRITFSPIAER